MLLSTAGTTIALPEQGKAGTTLHLISQPINNTFLRHTVAPLAIKCLSWRPRKDTVTFWTSSICYKQTKNLSEPYAMQLVGKKKTVPVLKFS
jgi:hypothetical protein